MTIKTFVFNPFQLNTYVLFDETNEAVIIDAGNNNKDEDQLLFDFVSDNNLIVKGLYYTHGHVDHIVGNNAIVEHFDINGAAHKDVLAFFEQAPTYAQSLGFSVRNLILPTEILADGDVIKFGESALSVLHTPGHADGSVCFYSEADQFVIVGDVLFKGSIGRTDLPSGNFNVLTQSILDKLYTLPSGVKVYSGHGPSTSIGFEKINNPFVNLL